MKFGFALGLLLSSYIGAVEASGGCKTGAEPFDINMVGSLAESSTDTYWGRRKNRRQLSGKGGKKGGKKGGDGMNFNKISTFFACDIDPSVGCEDDTETVAEIVDATDDGMYVIYTDAKGERIGFVSIENPYEPYAVGFVNVGGEPTSVRVWGKYALVGVNTSPDFVNPSGYLNIIDLETMESYTTLDLGGQPDAVAVSPDKGYVAIAIENERDEDLNDGEIPQMPAGYLAYIETGGVYSDPMDWEVKTVDLTGYGVAPSDPEPEYVDINEYNQCLVSLQENNALVIVDLTTGDIISGFDGGTVDLEFTDNTEEGFIEFCEASTAVPREPDAAVWLSNEIFVTADEGDYNGGPGTITFYNIDGDVLYTSYNDFDYLAASLGHYNEERSGNKGSEPETVYTATFGETQCLFVLLERAGLTVVYELDSKTKMPVAIKQALPVMLGPEGVVAIPERGLLVVSSEEDNRGDKFRGGLNIFMLEDEEAKYPTIVSAATSTSEVCGAGDVAIPITYGALSGLAVDPYCDNILYTIADSFYGMSRFFKLDTASTPAVLYEEIYMMDTNGVFAASPAATDSKVNDDGTINIDPEGIAVFENGDVLVASEASPPAINFVLKMTKGGVVKDVFTLPDEWNDKAIRFGFEGVAISPDQKMVVVAGQRAWEGDEHPALHIFSADGEYKGYVFYPLDDVESPRGGWIGLSDITPIGDKMFAILERDNQGTVDARVKKVYKVDLADWSSGETVDKDLVADLMPVLAKTNGPIPEKVEGLVYVDGMYYVNNDNDGVDENSGENQLLTFGH